MRTTNIYMWIVSRFFDGNRLLLSQVLLFVLRRCFLLLQIFEFVDPQRVVCMAR